jgi:hypothetical protein
MPMQPPHLHSQQAPLAWCSPGRLRTIQFNYTPDDYESSSWSSIEQLYGAASDAPPAVAEPGRGFIVAWKGESDSLRWWEGIGASVARQVINVSGQPPGPARSSRGPALSSGSGPVMAWKGANDPSIWILKCRWFTECSSLHPADRAGCLNRLFGSLRGSYTLLSKSRLSPASRNAVRALLTGLETDARPRASSWSCGKPAPMAAKA